MKQLFVSRTESDPEELAAVLSAHNYSLVARSFLAFEKVYTPLETQFDVIFFSSPRSVIFFIAQHALQAHTPIACAGRGTADFLLQATGRSADFTGQDSTDMQQVAENFKIWCAGRKVLFPVSDRSLKTVSSVFDPDQKVELITYKTAIKGQKIPECSVYVFTSPSNVEGFFAMNTLPKDARVIAWGKSTANALQERGVKQVEILPEASVKGLASYLSENL